MFKISDLIETAEKGEYILAYSPKEMITIRKLGEKWEIRQGPATAGLPNHTKKPYPYYPYKPLNEDVDKKLKDYKDRGYVLCSTYDLDPNEK